MAGQFGKYWNDLKKHHKRSHCWLPHVEGLFGQMDGSRPFRYFTLCSREMVDVFMLVNRGILKMEGDSAIAEVRFCELEEDEYYEILEMVGDEASGYFGNLEELLVFEDDEMTAGFSTIEEISLALEEERLPEEEVAALTRKRVHLHLAASFPYDCINLDFCDYYYSRPPDILKIHRAVETVLEWQAAAVESDSATPQEFLLCVTARHDLGFPEEAEDRLRGLVEENAATHDEYRAALEGRLAQGSVDTWLQDDPLDFFLSAWPKDLWRSGAKAMWNTEILETIHYARVGDSGRPYDMTCLVLRFSSASTVEEGGLGLRALDLDERTEIAEIGRRSKQGRELLADLREVVAVRNSRAEVRSAELLPNP